MLRLLLHSTFCVFLGLLPIKVVALDDLPIGKNDQRQVEELLQEAAKCENYEQSKELLSQLSKLSENLRDTNFPFRLSVEKFVNLVKFADYEKADKAFQISQELEKEARDLPTSVRLYLYRGVHLLCLGRNAEAIAALQNANVIGEGRPKDLAIVNNYLGVGLRRIGALDDAVLAYERALEYSTTASYGAFRYEITNNLGYLFLVLKQYDKAEKQYRLLMPVKPDKNAFLPLNCGMAEVELQKGYPLKARKRIERSLKLAKKDTYRAFIASANLVIGKTYLAEENWDKAEEYCRLAIRQYPDSNPKLADAQTNLGKSLIGKGEVATGLDLIQKVSKGASDVYEKFKAIGVLIDYYVSRGEFEKAFKQQQIANALREKQHLERIKLVEARFLPKLELEKTRSSEQRERARANSERLNALNSQLLAKTAEQEVATYRQIRNLALGVSLLSILGFFIYFRAEARRRAAQMQLVESRKRANLEKQLEHKKRVEAIGQLTGNVAHDFNNILQVVGQTNELLRGSVGGSDDEEQLKHLETSTEAVSLGAKITQQLLSFSKKQTINPRVTSVEKLFKSADMLFASVGGEHIQLQLNFSGTENDCVSVDRAQFSNAMLNILLNAKDAIGGKGVIDINVCAITADENDELLLLPDGDYIRIDVMDRGQGMSQENLAQACEPYFSTKENSGTGAGLGLSSVKGFVEQAGGQLFIASEQGVGTTVSLVLPKVYANASAEYEEQVAMDRKTNRKLRCLIVEDNQAVLETLSALLNVSGFECVCLKTADDAKEFLLNDSSFDIVISDIRLPGQMDGGDLAEWINSEFPKIFVLLASGDESPLHLEECHFLRKPFRFSELQKILDTVAGRATCQEVVDTTDANHPYQATTSK